MTPRRRILYHYPSSHLDSGSPRALLGVIDLLDRQQVEPLFLASAHGPLVDALLERGVEVVRGSVEPVGYRAPAASLARVRRQVALLRRERVDIVHLNEFGWNLDLVLAAWLARVPVVLHMHLPDVIAWQNLHRFAATRVLLVSEAQKRAVGGYARIRRKTAVLYNPVDIERYAAGQPIRERLGVHEGDVVVGSIAQIQRGKGIDVLLEAARRLLPRHPELVFLVAGRAGMGEEDFAERMMREARDPALRGRFRFLGSRTDVADLLASFDLFVLPTRAETFGIAIVEAMAAGVPVVASGVGAIPELLASPALGRVVPEVAAGPFVAAIEELLRLPDHGRAIGARARESLQGRLDRATLASRLQAVYDEVASR